MEAVFGWGCRKRRFASTSVTGGVLAVALALGAWAEAASAQDTYPEVTVRLISPSFSLGEGRTRGITVNLDRVPERKVWVDWELTHHGGADATDYSIFPSYFYFPPDARVQFVLVTARNDDFDDDCESVELSLVPRSPGMAGGGTLTISIRDDDGETVDCTAGGGGPLPPLPPAEPDPPPEPEPEPPPPPQPPTAAFAVEGATCGAELCHALTGAPVSFEDTSTGTVVSRRWEFGDGNTARSSAPEHAWSVPGFYEVTLEVSDGSSPSTARRTFLVVAASPRGTCVADAETLCLQDSRYAVAVEWWKGDDESGAGRVVHQGTNDSGLFAFFGRDNWEALIKVLDGCAMNGHMWVYGGSTTDLGLAIRVTDTLTGASKEYRNEPGTPAAAIADATAFPDGCRP